MDHRVFLPICSSVDPPFFQGGSDSSNEDKPFPFRPQLAPRKFTAAHSSSADDYRSVVDDLTVEIQKLKEELRRYKQKESDMLRKEKMFDVKVHGLSKRKKRQMEATLRDFSASLEHSLDVSSFQPRTPLDITEAAWKRKRLEFDNNEAARARQLNAMNTKNRDRIDSNMEAELKILSGAERHEYSFTVARTG